MNSVPEEDLNSSDYCDETESLLPSEFDLANGGGTALDGSKPVPCGHLCYIAAKLIIDAAFVSLYAVQVFGLEHLDCVLSTGANVTSAVKKSNTIMLFLYVADICALLCLAYFLPRNTPLA